MFEGNFVGFLLLLLQQHGFNLCYGILLLPFAFDRLPANLAPQLVALMHIICGSLRFAIMHYIGGTCGAVHV